MDFHYVNGIPLVVFCKWNSVNMQEFYSATLMNSFAKLQFHYVNGISLH